MPWLGGILFEPCVVLFGPGGVAACLWVGLNSLLLGFSCVPCSCSLLYSCSFVKYIVLWGALFGPEAVLFGPGYGAIGVLCLCAGIDSLLLGLSCVLLGSLCVPCSCCLLCSVSFAKFTGRVPLLFPITPVKPCCCWSPDQISCVGS